jgi:hypothetical protein
MSKAVVIVKCVGCGHKQEVKAGEIAPEDHPVCPKCFMPMIPVKAAASAEPFYRHSWV